jgi:antitoxin component of RelBE/YafQ-DinJ toxin-antitoxin module
MSDSTEIITIRVPKSLKEHLEKNSKKNQLSLNTLINQILNKKMHWDEQLTKLGWLPFDPYTVREIINYLTEEELTEISKLTQKKVTKGIKFIYGDTTLQNVVDFIDAWLSDANMVFRHTEDSESHRFIVHHELGKNWSNFVNKVVAGFIKELGYRLTDLSEKEDSYSFTISK